MHKHSQTLNVTLSPLARGDVSEADREVVASDTNSRYVSRKNNVTIEFKLKLVSVEFAETTTYYPTVTYGATSPRKGRLG